MKWRGSQNSFLNVFKVFYQKVLYRISILLGKFFVNLDILGILGILCGSLGDFLSKNVPGNLGQKCRIFSVWVWQLCAEVMQDEIRTCSINT
jgi:hypothetical protein